MKPFTFLHFLFWGLLLFCAGVRSMVVCAEAPIDLNEANQTFQSQRQGILTLERVLQLIDLYHPELDAARVKQQLARADLMVARSAFIPRLAHRSLLEEYRDGNYKRKSGYTAATEVVWQSPLAFELIGGWRSTSLPFLSDEGLTYTGNKAYFDSIKKNKLTGFTDDEMTFGFRLPLARDLFIDPFRANVKNANLQRQVIDVSVLQKRAELYRKASEKFYDWTAAGMQYRVADNLLKIARERTAAIEERAKGGAIPPIDVTEAESQVKLREENLAKSLRSFQKEALALSLFLWDDRGSFPRVPGINELAKNFPEPNPIPKEIWQTHLNRAIERRPEILSLLYQRKQADVNLRLARNELLPKIDLEVLPTQDLNRFDSGTNIRGSINLDVPLYPLKAQGQISKAQGYLKTLELQHKLQQNQIQNEVQDALSFLETSRERVARAREARDKLRVMVEGENTRFQFGASNLFLLNAREFAYADSEIKVIEALNDFQKGVANYKYAVGLWSNANTDELVLNDILLNSRKQ